MDYTNKVEIKMNEYLEKSGVVIQDILGNTDAFVFGGALRDAIADVEINDIDIIGFSRSINDISQYLENNSFKRSLNEEFDELYHGISLFSNPGTYTKNGINVQVISLNPMHKLTKRSMIRDNAVGAIKSVIRNVDIDICALSYHPKTGLKEELTEVIQNIENKEFEVLEDTIMHQENRIEGRIQKMINKGYTPLNTKPIKMEELKRYNAWEN